MLTQQIKNEIQNPAVSPIRIIDLLPENIFDNRLQVKNSTTTKAYKEAATHQEPFILRNLKEAIEKDFKTKHTASDYADALHISAKALAKITKTYFNRTLTDLIQKG